MSHHHSHVRPVDSYEIDPRKWAATRNVLLGLLVVSGILCAIGWVAEPKQFYGSYLTAFVYVLSMLFGAMFFIQIQHLTSSAWSVTVRRLAENLVASMPVMAILFLVLATGVGTIYEWATHPAHGKEFYFSPGFFYGRAAVYFLIWTVWGLRLAGSREGIGRWCAPGLPLLFLSATLASFDWVMSLNQHWYSTMFGIYILAGGAFGFYALLTRICLNLRGQDILTNTIHVEHYHDLGKWMFAHTVFWGYIAFCQYMLIWYANLPEETIFYKQRLVGTWRLWGDFLIVGHFIVPFLVLVARNAKRNFKVLNFMTVWILLMHYVDIYFLIQPAFHADGVGLHWMDLAAVVAVMSAVLTVFWFRMKSGPIVAVDDPQFAKGLEFQNV